MQVVTYTSDMSPDLASSYTRLVHNLPYCYPITRGDFDAAAFVADGETSHRGVVHDAVFVAVDNSRPAGFLHVAIAPDPEDEDGPLGLTRFFWYERGHRAAGRRCSRRRRGTLAHTAPTA